MKRKFTLLLAALATIASTSLFVSCKDTNEDLYNDLKLQQIDSESSLQAQLDALTADLQAQKDAYQKALDELKKDVTDNKCQCSTTGSCGCTGSSCSCGGTGSCTCSSTLGAQIAALENLTNSLQGEVDNLKSNLTDPTSPTQTAIAEAQTAIATTTQQVNDLTQIVNELKNNYSSVSKNWITKDAAETLIQEAVDKLQAEIDNLKNCSCVPYDDSAVYAKIADVQKTMEEALALTNEALAKTDETAKAALAGAEAAANAAAAAQTLAQNAQAAADQAKADAAAAKNDAADSKAAAEAAAEAAQKTADAAQAVADAAQSTADQVIADLALKADQAALDDLKALVEANSQAIKDNAAAIATNNSNIEKNAQDIADHNTKILENAEKIAENAAEIVKINTAIADIYDQLTALDTDVKKALKDAAEAAAAAAANKIIIDGLVQDVAANAAAIEGLDEQVTNLTNTVNDLEQRVANNTTAINNLINAVNNLNNATNALDQKIDDAKADFNAALSAQAALQKEYTDAALETAKAYADAQVALVYVELAKLDAQKADKSDLDNKADKSDLDNLASKADLDDKADRSELANLVASADLDAVEAYLQARIDSLAEVTKNLNQASSEITNIESSLSDISSSVTNIEGSITNIQGDISNIEGSVSTIEGNISTINQNITNVTNKMETIEGNVQTITNQITTITNGLSEKASQAGLDEANLKISTIETTIDNLKEYVDFQDEAIKKLLADGDANLQDQITNILTQISEDKKEILEKIIASEEKVLKEMADGDKALQDQITANYQDLLDKIAEGDNKLAEKDKELLAQILGNTSSISTLNSTVSNLQTQIDGIQKQIDEINEKLDTFVTKDELAKTLANLVTSINVQSVYNPAFGSISLPANVNSNILIGYYGKALNDVQFPTAKTGNNVKNSGTLSAADIEMMKLSGLDIYEAFSGDQLISDAEDNAGKIYMTVNPSSVDASGLEVSLENSQAKSAGLQLSALKKTNQTLTFGYTRAADNGFYVANARMDNPSKVQQIDIDKEALVDDFKEIYNKRQKADFAGMASDVYNLVKAFSLDANAVKCTNGTRSVYSQYNIAATAVKPISLGSYEDFNYVTLPGYEKAMNLIDKVSEKANNQIKVIVKDIKGSTLVKNIQNLEIKDIEIADLSAEKLAKFNVTMDTTVNFTMDGLKYHLNLSQVVNVPVKFSKDINVPISIDKDVEVDLSTVSVVAPTVVINTSLSTKDDEGNKTAYLLVPVYDEDGAQVGTAEVPLDQVEVNSSAKYLNDKTGEAISELTLNGTPVAHVVYKENVPVRIDVDETVQTTVNIEKDIFFGDNGTDTMTRKIHLWFSYDLSDAAKDLWGEAQSALGSVNDMLADIREIVANANDILDMLDKYENSLTSTITNYADKAKSYLEKINKRIVNAINHVNFALQPIMMASDANGSKLMSGTKNHPTKVAAKNLQLYGTTWNAEILCPIYKKHIAVTNVIKGSLSAKGGNSTLRNVLVQANSGNNMNKVVDGSIRKFDATKFKAGYTYEIAYSALDFHGKISVKKFYVTVSK